MNPYVVHSRLTSNSNIYHINWGGRIKGWCRAAPVGEGRQASGGAVEEGGIAKVCRERGEDLNSLRSGREFFTGEFVWECRIGF